MSEVKAYQVEGLEFEFSPNGFPLEGHLTVIAPEGTFGSKVSLEKLGSRKAWANEAAQLYGMDAMRLRLAPNELCTLKAEEVAAATAQAEQSEEEPEPVPEEAEALVSAPSVLDRYVKDVARIRGVVKDRDPLRLQTLIAVGAQLAPLAGGKPAGANLILAAEAGRGKNYICDAVASALPEEFCLPSKVRAQRASTTGPRTTRRYSSIAGSTRTRPRARTSSWRCSGPCSPVARPRT